MFPNGSCLYLQCKTNRSPSSRNLSSMFVRTHYTRFLFIFIVYLAFTLLIMKIRNGDHTYSNISKVHKSVLPVDRFSNLSVTIEKKKSKILSTLSTTFEEFADELKNNQKARKQIFETCKENNVTTTSVKRTNFLYSSNHNALYCYIRKAGSTSFTKLFSKMNGSQRNRDFYKEIPSLAPKDDALLKRLTTDEKVFKILVVRHPFERLVSAYRDRIEDNSRYTAQSWIYVPKIFHLTRPELFYSPGPVDSSLMRIFYEDKRLKIIPSFKEFVKWILHQDFKENDPHWNQYYKHCALCSVQYDFVLRLDNYTQRDIDYIFTRLSLDDKSIHLSKLEQTKQGSTHFEEACNYFKNLTHETVVNLYEKYRIDFDMFNYEFDKYFECIEGD